VRHLPVQWILLVSLPFIFRSPCQSPIPSTCPSTCLQPPLAVGLSACITALFFRYLFVFLPVSRFPSSDTYLFFYLSRGFHLPIPVPLCAHLFAISICPCLFCLSLCTQPSYTYLSVCLSLSPLSSHPIPVGLFACFSAIYRPITVNISACLSALYLSRCLSVFMPLSAQRFRSVCLSLCPLCYEHVLLVPYLSALCLFIPFVLSCLTVSVPPTMFSMFLNFNFYFPGSLLSICSYHSFYFA